MLVATIAMGCQTMKPIHTVETVDLKRFMGDWYVIESIPTFIEKKAFNAVESYRLEEDGTIATTFRFNNGRKRRDRKMPWVCLHRRDRENAEQ